MNSFIPNDEILLQPLGRGREFRLLRDLTFHSDRHGRFTVPAMFECDLSSIPLDGFGFGLGTDWPQAGVLHDWLYRMGVVPRGVADDLYREALVACGCGSLRARWRWLALRAFGWKAYKG